MEKFFVRMLVLLTMIQDVIGQNVFIVVVRLAGGWIHGKIDKELWKKIENEYKEFEDGYY